MVGLVGAGGVLSQLQEALTPFFAGSWAASGWVPRVLISAHARRESITNSVFIGRHGLGAMPSWLSSWLYIVL